MSNCTTFNAHVVDQVVTLSNLPLIAAGGVGEVQIRCTFCGKWDGCGKVAVFYRDGGDVYHVLVVGGVATVPHEVLAEPGFFYLGFMGQADIVRTSEVVRVEVKEGAITVPTAQTKEPTPDIYQQMLTAHGILDARFNEAIAMRSGSGSLKYHADGNPVEVDITSNGAVASITVSLHNISSYAPQGGAVYESKYCIPPAFAPMSLVELTDAGMGTNYLSVMIDPDRANADGWCNVRVAWGWDGDELAALETYAGNYDLAAVHVDEVADLRVGYNGVSHPTAGEAVRNQVRALVDVCSAPFEETGTTVRCDPFMVGDPLNITSPALETEGHITITRAGENPPHEAETFTLYATDIKPDIQVDFTVTNNYLETSGSPLRMRNEGDGKIVATKTVWAGPLPDGFSVQLFGVNDPPIVLGPNNSYVLRGCPAGFNGQVVTGGYVAADVCRVSLSGKDAEGNHHTFHDRGDGVELTGLVKITTMTIHIGVDYGVISSDLIFEPRVEPLIKGITTLEGTNVLTVVEPAGAVMTVSGRTAKASGSSTDEEVYELIETIEVTEPMTIERKNEPDGTPYNFKALTVQIETTASAWANTRFFCTCMSPSVSITSWDFSFTSNTGTKRAFIKLYQERGWWEASMIDWYNYQGYTNLKVPCSDPRFTDSVSNAPAIQRFFNTNTIPAGTTIKIWGVRAQ